MDMSPHTPLKPHHYELRHKIMNNNGIHIIYPLGRDFAIGFPGNFDAYEGLTVRVFGYTRDAGPLYEHAIARGSDYCLIKFSKLKPIAYINSWSYDSKKNDHVYGPGTFYTFAIRAIKDKEDRESFEAIVEEEAVKYGVISWSGVAHYEIIDKGKMVHLSKHVGDEEGTTKFPTSTGLDPYLKSFVSMEVGTIAHYTGVYSGTSEVRVNAVGAVQDMGRPNHSVVTIRISIRKTLLNYIFFSDYGSEPVVAPFGNLVSTGHRYAPRFSMNFSVRQVHMDRSTAHRVPTVICSVDAWDSTPFTVSLEDIAIEENTLPEALSTLSTLYWAFDIVFAKGVHKTLEVIAKLLDVPSNTHMSPLARVAYTVLKACFN